MGWEGLDGKIVLYLPLAWFTVLKLWSPQFSIYIILKNSTFIFEDVRNAGKECFQKCKMQNGPCDWCGPDGWCCRLNRVRNGCDGTFGGANQHQCVLNPGIYGILNTCFLVNNTKFWRHLRKIYYAMKIQFNDLERNNKKYQVIWVPSNILDFKLTLRN